MQVPLGPDSTPSKTQESGSRIPIGLSSAALSVESQIKVRELYKYVEASRAALKEVHGYLVLFKANPECFQYPKRASERLEGFCIEADSWGFEGLYEIGLGLQVLLLDAHRRARSHRFWEALDRGLSMLVSLLEQCERDFLRRLAVADVVDFIKHTARS